MVAGPHFHNFTVGVLIDVPLPDLDDLFVNTEVVVIDGDALEVDYDNAGYFSSENSYEVSVDDMLFDNTVGEQLMDCGFFGTQS